MANAGKKKGARHGGATGKGGKARSRPETARRGIPEAEPLPEASTTRFICKVCGDAFDRRDALNMHMTGTHHPRRTVTATDIITGVFEGGMNFPKTKAEIVRYVEENKDREAVTTEVIDTVRNMPDKLYFTEADFVYSIEQTLR